MRTDLTTFEKTVQQHNIDIHSIIVVSNEKILIEKYYRGRNSVFYEPATLHPMFSITKSFVGIATGLLCGEKRISLSDSVIRYFPEYEKYADENIRKTSIEDLLTMTGCHSKTTYKINPESNWIESFFTTPSDKVPGSSFDYETSGSHILCALIKKCTGLSLLEYLNSKINNLNISNTAYVRTDPFGAEMGGAGLICTPHDLIGFSNFVNSSIKKTNSLFPADYLNKATSQRVSTLSKANLAFKKYGYGYYFWIQPKNRFLCYGQNGQFIYFSENGFVITTADTSSDPALDQKIIEAIEKAFM